MKEMAVVVSCSSSEVRGNAPNKHRMRLWKCTQASILDHHFVKMHFSPLIAALVLTATTRFSFASTVIPAEKYDCVTVEDIEGAHGSLWDLSKKYNFPFPEDFPNLDAIRQEHPRACAPEGLIQAVADVMIKVGTEHDFESKLAEMEAFQPERTTPAHSLLDKRARSCPEVRDDTKAKAYSSWSCNSALHPDKCRSCTNFVSFLFAGNIGVCLAKNPEEGFPCCAVAATQFLSKYTQDCLER
jgi:hypothetical protein